MLFFIDLILGIGLLVAGRKVFWLFVAAAGFFAGVELTTRFFHGPEGLSIVVGIVVGILFAILAMALKSIAIGIAGFFLGGAAFLALATSFGVERGELIIYIVGGIIGVIFLSIFFDWALIGISSFAGASILVQTLALERPMAGLAFIVLLIAGIAIQFADKNRETKVLDD
jgi:hypothetical protein